MKYNTYSFKSNLCLYMVEMSCAQLISNVPDMASDRLLTWEE